MAAIVFDGKASLISGGLSTDQVVNFNHQVGSYSGTMLILVAMDYVASAGGAGGMQSATYNGTSFTWFAGYQNLGFNLEFYYLFNPTPGVNTVSITWDPFTSSDGNAFYTTSWVNLTKKAPINSNAYGYTLDGTSAISNSLTPKRGNSLILSAFADDAASAWSGPVNTSLYNDSGSQTYALNYKLNTSNADKTAVTDGFTTGTSSGSNYVGYMVEINMPLQVASAPDPFMF